MARHEIRAAKPRPQEPRAQIKAAPTLYDKIHPVGSAERFLDDAAKEALASAAAGGLPTPKQLMPAAVKAMIKETGRYPDPLLERIARLPDKELLARAARAEAYQRAMEAQNAAVDALSATMSPVADIARTQAAAAIAVHQDAKGGDSVSENPEAVSENPETVSENPETVSRGPRIVINPTTFANKKDALCVAFNEGFRLWMESAGFEPQSEPTDAQRRFFSDTAYADDEVQLRRTILARIATFDTSVKDPTDDQLSETASFLNEILESDWCRNDWERDCVARLANAVQAAVGAEPVEPRQEPLEPREPEPLQKRAALGAGETEDDEEKKNPAPVPQDQGGETQEGAETTLTSGSGAEVRYNEDGTFAGQTNPDGSYSVASASGDVANYNPDGTLQGDRSRFEAEGTTAAESAVARADRLLEKLKGIKEQVDAVDAKYGISERLAPASVAEDKPADAPEGQPGDGGSGYTPPAGVAIVAVPAAKKPAAEAPAQDNGPAAGTAQTAAPAAAAPAAAAGRQIGDIGAKSFTDTKHMNGPSIQPAQQIGDVGAKSFTDTKHMNGPSIQPAQQIGDVGAKSFTDTQTMNGPSIEPARPIGTIDTADGSGGSTLRRKKRRHSRI